MVVAVIVALDVCVPVRVATIVLEPVTEVDDVLEIEDDALTVAVVNGVYEIRGVKDCVVETVDVREAGAERVLVAETLEVFVEVELPVIVGLTRPDSERTFVTVLFELAEFVLDTVFVRVYAELFVTLGELNGAEEKDIVTVILCEEVDVNVLDDDLVELAETLRVLRAVGEFAGDAPTVLDVVADFVKRVDAL